MRELAEETLNKITNWLLHGETGISSKNVVSFLLYGKLTDAAFHPADPSDLRRCYLLFKQVPELLPLFKSEMSKASPYWAGIANNWDLLVQILELEMNQKCGRANKTYQLMKLIEELVISKESSISATS